MTEALSMKQLAAAKRMLPDAAVEAEVTTTIDAQVDRVWNLMTDVLSWPAWYGYLSNAELDGPFAVGCRVQYGGIIKHKLTVGLVEPRRALVLYGTMLGVPGITLWQFESLGKRTRVQVHESSDGLLVRLMYGNHRLETHLRDWSLKLKAEAERSGATSDQTR